MEGKKILVIDDDMNLCQSLKIGFSFEGIDVETAIDGRMGLKQFYKHQPDLVILDIRMPEMDGWETCRQIRLLSDVPIIMLTSLNHDQEIVRGLRCGADDFVTKPFSREVLAARASAVLRRTETIQDTQDASVYDDDYLYINLDQREIQVQGELIKLSSTEFQLLSYLFENAGRILTYETILNNVWGWEYQNSVDYVHVYLSHLRKKIEDDPRNPRYLVNERGVGYRFEKYAR